MVIVVSPLLSIPTFIALGLYGHPLAPFIIWPVPVAALVFALMKYKQTEYVQFRFPSGVAILDVGRVRPDVAHFSDFVAGVTERVLQTENGG